MINWTFVRQVGLARWAFRYSLRQIHKRVLDRDSQLKLPTGTSMTLPAESTSATEVYVTNANIDWGSEALFARFADRRRDFLDIGSHIGYYAAYLSPCVRRVYAFEPNRQNLPALRKNASLSKNIEVVEAAVSSYDGTGSFYEGAGSAVSTLERIGGSARQVSVITIDTFAATRSDLDVCLIKTDIEGHDLQALRGMRATIARHRPLILSECRYSEEVYNLCNHWCYSIFAFTRDKNTLKTRFEEIGPEDNAPWTKMLFLVPQHLKTAFQQIADVKALRRRVS